MRWALGYAVARTGTGRAMEGVAGMFSGDVNLAAGGAIGLAAAAVLATQCTNGAAVDEGMPLKGLPTDFDADAAVSTEAPTEIHADALPGDSRKTIVVVGLSMVGWRFCEALIQNDTAKEYRACKPPPALPSCPRSAAPLQPRC